MCLSPALLVPLGAKRCASFLVGALIRNFPAFGHCAFRVMPIELEGQYCQSRPGASFVQSGIVVLRRTAVGR